MSESLIFRKSRPIPSSTEPFRASGGVRLIDGVRLGYMPGVSSVFSICSSLSWLAFIGETALTSTDANFECFVAAGFGLLVVVHRSLR